MAREAFAEQEGTFLDRLIYRWRTRTALRFLADTRTLCDLGCGRDATLLRRLLPQLERGWGVDGGVDGSLASDRLTLLRADFNLSLPLPEEIVDTATSLAVIEHIDDYMVYLKEAYRILKPGGTIVITTPRPQGKIVLEMLSFLRLIDTQEINDHKRYFDKKMLVSALESNGFRDIHYQTFQLGFNQLITGKK